MRKQGYWRISRLGGELLPRISIFRKWKERQSQGACGGEETKKERLESVGYPMHDIPIGLLILIATPLLLLGCPWFARVLLLDVWMEEEGNVGLRGTVWCCQFEGK
jgi:hypothetical protein